MVVYVIVLYRHDDSIDHLEHVGTFSTQRELLEIAVDYIYFA